MRWTETEVGTNAIGTALEIGEAVTIHGTEHFSVASHHWSCSAAPIRDEDGTVMGLIDISCLTDRRHPFMLGMAATAAHAIEREISAHTKKTKPSSSAIVLKKSIRISRLSSAMKKTKS